MKNFVVLQLLLSLVICSVSCNISQTKTTTVNKEHMNSANELTIDVNALWLNAIPTKREPWIQSGNIAEQEFSGYPYLAMAKDRALIIFCESGSDILGQVHGVILVESGFPSKSLPSILKLSKDTISTKSHSYHVYFAAIDSEFIETYNRNIFLDQDALESASDQWKKLTALAYLTIVPVELLTRDVREYIKLKKIKILTIGSDLSILEPQ